MKEIEIANLEQRYTLQGQQPTVPIPRLQASEVPTIRNQSTVNAPPKPTFVTPNLEAIRKLRKTRGVSRKSRLIGMLVEDEDTSHTPGGQQGTTLSIGTNAPDHVPADIHIDATTQALQEAITKGVDIAFRKMFTSSQFSPSSRPSPRRRKAQIDEVEAIKGSESKEDRCFMLVSHFKIRTSSQLTYLITGKGLKLLQDQVRVYPGH
ncbi:hypothetical protein JVT61DRAFT_2535 [Boletus reticuloceps]|uniref:Uncharacterized protein n=1 Tax=Boletus reticuloceps TaxID=495285 RepID=A0A8I2YQF4_9AGAM|nr:hypothetical protein JVT61DRAFT_2535 [Boletus reticuloceps]